MSEKLIELSFSVLDGAGNDTQVVLLEDAEELINKLEKGYRLLMKEWIMCGDVSPCPGLGYPIEEWCVYCVSEKMLEVTK
mgnify:CR=1 FL=1